VSKTKLFRNTAIALAVVGPMTAAMATNGYFSHGYGIKAKGMGGAAVASVDSAFAGANNPATAAFAGNRMEIGLDLFMPEREMSRTGSAADVAVKSDSNLFYVPEFGYNRAIGDTMGFNLSVYGNGGLNTDYPGGQTDCTLLGGGPGQNALCGLGRLGVDMMQLVVAPTFAYKVAPNHAIGVSPLLVQQQFKAEGLQLFANTPGMSSDPASVTGNGYDSSTGVGIRVGYLGKLTDSVNVGIAYAPKITMSKFDKYKGLFADSGNFDIPENYNVGATFKATPTVMIAAEYGFIKYSAVPSVGNPSTNPTQLGAPNGPGFGWADVSIYKLGVEWQQSGNLTLRAGVNVGDNPIKSRDVTFNILAPGVTTTHYTLGGTYALSKASELTVAYMMAPSNSVSGAAMFGGSETIKMSQQSLGIQFGWKY
jgi:long-chain fatty acid transport protein